MPTASSSPHTIESLLRLVQVRDAEVALLKLTVEKLKASLLRRTRAQYGTSSEQWDAQLSLIAGQTEAGRNEPTTICDTPAGSAAQKPAANDNESDLRNSFPIPTGRG